MYLLIHTVSTDAKLFRTFTSRRRFATLFVFLLPELFQFFHFKRAKEALRIRSCDIKAKKIQIIFGALGKNKISAQVIKIKHFGSLFRLTVCHQKLYLEVGYERKDAREIISSHASR